MRRILGLQEKAVHLTARLIFSRHLIDHLWGVAGHATNLVSCMAAELNTVWLISTLYFVYKNTFHLQLSCGYIETSCYLKLQVNIRQVTFLNTYKLYTNRSSKASWSFSTLSSLLLASPPLRNSTRDRRALTMVELASTPMTKMRAQMELAFWSPAFARARTPRSVAFRTSAILCVPPKIVCTRTRRSGIFWITGLYGKGRLCYG